MSTLKADTIQSTGGGAVTLTKQSAAKAFISFDGTGTVSIDTSFNISTLTDNAAADYSIAYTNNVSTSNHPVTGSNIGSSETNYLNLILINQLLIYFYIYNIHSLIH